MLRSALKKNIASEVFVVVGFPRNIQQVQCFQERIQCGSPPVTVLLDCSELELARNLGQRRNRLDDNKVDLRPQSSHYTFKPPGASAMTSSCS